jgi:hypothetical protein
MRVAATLIFAGLLLAAPPVSAQEKKESGTPGVYRVEFNIRDGSEAAARAGRRFDMLIESGGKGTLRVGNRVPVVTGTAGSGPTSYQFFEVSVNIDCRLREVSGMAEINADLDISNILEPEKTGAGAPPNPTVANLRLSVNTLLALGKPALVASIDDPVTRRRFELETTVTKVN